MGGFDYGGKMIYSPMMQQYLQTKDEYKDSILLYRLGDFYEMFFDDAIKASEILDLVLTSKVCGQKCKAPMCGIPYHAVDNYIAKLIEAGEKVAICEQLSEPNSRELVKRGVVRVVTPGTVVENTILNEKNNNYLAVVFSDGKTTAAAYCDITTGRFFAHEFSGALRPRTDHHWAFDRYAGRLELERSFKPGHYVLEPGMNVVEIARMLKLGMQTPVRVTLNYARTRAFLASRLARQLDADSAELMRALTDPQLAREVGTDSLQLFSIFIPNTYEFYWTVSPEDFVRRMRKEYDRFWTPERDAARRRSGLSRDEVMTLASIVTEETNKADEMPRVAGVYINRLRKGMPLQADPTVKYALQDFSLRRILHKHLRTPSPYNTYLNKGLPPSSIAMPSVAAIDGVLNFENHDYLFFCARPTFDGYHSFARTYGEHLANARAYSAELNRRNIK